MANWREMLKEAKDLFDEGLINEKDYEQLKQEALALRRKSSSPSRSAPPKKEDTFSGKTRLAFEVNKKIGQYKILQKIGEGGMGTVYLARHAVESFAQHTGNVALKILKPELSQDPEFAKRFTAEAGIARRLSHPNILRVHEVIYEPDSGLLALVMDFIEGEALTKKLRALGMEHEQAFPILKQLSEAIDYLHSQKVVHRDLKPDNIIISPKGKVTILDMGIAKNTQGNLEETRTGIAMGTPIYMAPEQMDAKNVTSAADRYALGLIAYRMLTGRLPWGSKEGMGEILTRKLTGKYELFALAFQTKHIQRTLIRMLDSSPRKRWSSCSVFYSQLLESDEDREKKRIFEELKQKIGEEIPKRKPSIVSVMEKLHQFLSKNLDFEHPYLQRVGKPRFEKNIHRTINGALKKAKDGSVIWVEEGEYQENLAPDKSIHISGGGKVKISSSGRLALSDHQAEKAYLSIYGCTLTSNEIRVIQCLKNTNRTSIVKCVVEGGNGILVKNTNLLLFSSIIRNSRNVGMAIVACDAWIENNDILENRNAGIQVGSVGKITIRKNRFYRNKEAGLLFYEKANALVEHNDIFENILSGISIQTEAEPVIGRNKICRNKESGIFASKKATGTIENNSLFENGISGIMVTTEAKPTITANKIYKNKASGIALSSEGGGDIGKNSLFENALSGIDIQTEADPRVFENKIYQNIECGLFIHSEGKGRVENNDISENGLSGIVISKGGDPKIIRNQIYKNKAQGITSFQNGAGFIERNAIFENALSGVAIETGGNPMVQENRIHNNTECGIASFKTGAGILLKNEVFGNKMQDVYLEEGSKTRRHYAAVLSNQLGNSNSPKSSR